MHSEDVGAVALGEAGVGRRLTPDQMLDLLSAPLGAELPSLGSVRDHAAEAFRE